LRDCPRWPEEFWLNHLQRGGGGTCFESNYAFSALLNGLGFEGYLTVNNMEESIGCHAAIVVLLDGEKWLVDAGFPMYAPVPVKAEEATAGGSPYQHYTVHPQSSDSYRIERRPHPEPYAFTLIDRPVDLDEYRQTMVNDYGPNGHFLQRVIVHKIVEEKMWRFTSSEEPSRLTCFAEGRRFDTIINGDVAAAVAAKFDIDEAAVRRALELIQGK
jgi:arylamine N-acetyltransferase